MSTPLLSVRDLCIRIPGRGSATTPVDGVGFDVHPGEILGLVGESGSGKSLTLRALMGLLPAPAEFAGGTVRFKGEDLRGLARREMRRRRGRDMAMVFQDPLSALNPVMRVGDQVSEALRAATGASRAEARTRVGELLREVGLPDPEHRSRMFPHQLSGGQRQRVMIASALSGNPELLLCDEPTTALDVTVQQQILWLLAELSRARGVGVVLVTHDLAVVAQTCHRVAVMYAGEVVETGTVDQIFTAPRHPYTVGLLAAVPDIDNPGTRLRPVPAPTKGEPVPPGGCRFAVRCSHRRSECTPAGRVPLTPVAAGHEVRCLRTAELSAEAAGGLR